MKKLLVLVILLGIFPAQLPAQTPANAHKYEFANGNWFDGLTFVPRTFYSVGGILTSKRPARIDRVFDFSGKYIVPPFGEAHNHNLDWSSDDQFARINKRYLDAGIFYVKNPNSLLRSKQPTAAHINLHTTVDGILSNGGLTGSGGHPIEIVSPQRGFKPGDGEGGFYYVIDSAAEFERKWPAILAGQPDFIKTYLLYSEEYAQRKDDKAYDGWKGLDPSVLPLIVRRAHAAGLRVSTHVETLNLLRQHRVSIAIGSDSFRQTALAEALSLAKLKALDNLTLLKMWCEATAATIFPKRKIGYLKEGYIANFLVLTANPLTDFANTKTIELRIKQGEPLQP